MKQKTKKASILAFTLIMMGILLVAGLSLMGATIVDQKVALESGNSIQALQNAESGTEVAVSVLSGNFATDPNKDQLSEVFQDHGFICSGNEVIESDYTLTFYDKDENQLDCTDDIADAESVKSVGTNQNTTRAVQVALALSASKVIGGFQTVHEGNGSFEPTAAWLWWGVVGKADIENTNLIDFDRDNDFDKMVGSAGVCESIDPDYVTVPIGLNDKLGSESQFKNKWFDICKTVNIEKEDGTQTRLCAVFSWICVEGYPGSINDVHNKFGGDWWLTE